MTDVKLNKSQQKVTEDGLSMAQQASALAVRDADTYEEAAAALKPIKAMLREANKVFDPPLKKMNEALRELRDAKRKVTDPLTDAEKTIKRSMAAWVTLEETKRIAAEREAQAQARAQAEADRQAEAEAAAAAGDQQMAEAIAEEPVVPPSVAVATAVPKISGISSRTLHKAKVTDIVALLAHVYENCVEHPELLAYLEINQRALNDWARNTKGGATIPGVEHYTETSMAAG